MRLQDLITKFKVDGVFLKFPFMSLKIEKNEAEQNAAFELALRLRTTIATRPLSDVHGVDQSALDSLYKTFCLAREIMEKHGKAAPNFYYLTTHFLNYTLAPFTEKWHPLSHNDNCFEGQCKNEYREMFRDELRGLQEKITPLCGLLEEIAGVYPKEE